MIFLIVLSLVVIGFVIHHYFEFGKYDKGAILPGIAIGIIGLLLVWFVIGMMVPYKDVYKDITKEIQIARAENFVVFSYKNKLIKTTNYDIVKNPEKSRVYLKEQANIFGSVIEEQELKEENSLVIK